MGKKVKEISESKSWGIDADPENDPTYPLKHHTHQEHAGYSWKRPVQQPVNIEVLHSNERPGPSAVFGTSVPPSGLSGMIRRYAFRYSEGSFAHWLPLVLADRINVVEGIIDDLSRGIVPNIYAEKGWKAIWKYNKKSALLRILSGTLVVSGAAVFLFRKKIFPQPYYLTE